MSFSSEKSYGDVEFQLDVRGEPETDTLSQPTKVLSYFDKYYVAPERPVAVSTDIRSLLQTILENQRSLRAEIAYELKISRISLQSELSRTTGEINDKLDRGLQSIRYDLQALAEDSPKSRTRSFDNEINTFRRCARQLDVSIDDMESKIDTIRADAADAKAVKSLLKTLIEDQGTLRAEILEGLRVSDAQITDELMQLVRRTAVEVDRKLSAVEEEVAKTRLTLDERASVLRDFVGDLVAVKNKIDVVQRKVDHIYEQNSGSALTMLNQLQAAQKLMKMDVRRAPNEGEPRTKIATVLNETVEHAQKHSASVLRDVKEMVIDHNKQSASVNGQLEVLCGELCRCDQKVTKVDGKLKVITGGDFETVDYNETTFWNKIETYKVSPIDDYSLGVYVKTFLIRLLTAKTKPEFYSQAFYCAVQVRDPACAEELAIVNEEPLAQERNEVKRLERPEIDWSETLSNSDEIFSSLTNEEQYFIEKVFHADDRILSIWGPAFACVLLKLGDRGARYVLAKLQKLNQVLAENYDVDPEKLPSAPLDCEEFASKLKQCSGYVLDETLANTLYKGMIERYESRQTSSRTKRVLNFFILKSLRYREMPLLTLVDEVLKLYRVDLFDLIEHTAFCKTIDSWKRFYSFVISEIYQRHKKWKYCTSFRSNPFSSFSFDANYSLCSVLCIVIDVFKMKHRKSKVLYHRLLKMSKPEWTLSDFEVRYIKSTIKVLHQMSKVAPDVNFKVTTPT